MLAQGGPPLRTDDPGTPGNRNWEINISSTQNFSRGEREIEAPLLDMNYGLGDRIQLKYEIPYLYNNNNGRNYRGTLANSLLGLKWRFFQQRKEGGWNISTYPQVEFNNPDSAYARGLVERGPRLLLPVEITRVFGPIEVNLEVGYWFAKERRHERIVGLAFGHRFTGKFEGLAEIYDDVLLGGGERSTSIDIGGRYEFHKDLLLIFMAGRSPLRSPCQAFGQPTFVGYFGLQVQINHKKQPKAANRHPK